MYDKETFLKTFFKCLYRCFPDEVLFNKRHLEDLLSSVNVKERELCTIQYMSNCNDTNTVTKPYARGCNTLMFMY